MSNFPNQINKFIDEFSKVPSIGPRMARRLAFYFINLDDQKFQNLSQALSELDKVNRCPRCFFVKNQDKELCNICSNPSRDQNVIAVVEKETDLLSIEQTNTFGGTYLIIGESTGKGELSSKQKLRLKHLINLADKSDKEQLKEVILATSPTSHGDFLAQTIQNEIREKAKKISRLGRGLPTGGEVEFADEETLKQALERRS